MGVGRLKGDRLWDPQEMWARERKIVPGILL